jgi:hypothetical protein
MSVYRDMERCVKYLWDNSLAHTQVKNMVQMARGIVLSPTGRLSEVARRFVGRAGDPHKVKRAHRFVSNERLSPTKISGGLLKMARGVTRGRRYWPIIIDYTDVEGYQVLQAAVPYRGRAVTIAEKVFTKAEISQMDEYSQNLIEQDFIDFLRTLCPKSRIPLLIADRGFGRADLLLHLQQTNWAFVIRVKGDVSIQHRLHHGLLKNLPIAIGEQRILRDVDYRADSYVQVNLVAACADPNDPWFLATTLSTAHLAVYWYEKRFWIEEVFKDWKEFWHLERLRLKTSERVERFLLAWCFAYNYVLLLGAKALSPARIRQMVSRPEDYSPFWLGRQFLASHAQFVRGRPPSVLGLLTPG